MDAAALGLNIVNDAFETSGVFRKLPYLFIRVSLVGNPRTVGYPDFVAIHDPCTLLLKNMPREPGGYPHLRSAGNHDENVGLRTHTEHRQQLLHGRRRGKIVGRVDKPDAFFSAQVKSCLTASVSGIT